MQLVSLIVIALAAALPGAAQKLTPPPGPAPHLNGPRVYGVRPGRPFLYRIPCTGTRPIRFSARSLPPWLTLDAATGIITGAAPPHPGTRNVTLRARNAFGSSRRSFQIVLGDTLALTPPMGWNHWYTHYHRISDSLFRAAADAMISSGMADFGYQYVNIDDCWMVRPGSTDPMLLGPARDAAGNILPNRNFPDLKAMTGYIHSKGLKTGIYTSPGPLTCARYEGSYQHEEADARQFAEWGFDFLKYDWCSYRSVAKGETVAERRKPYDQMGAILKTLPRDIVFNLCQYGLSDVWQWGAEAGGHAWRTTGDLGLEKDTNLPGFYSIAFANARHWEYAGPGRWNDPDYILIGYIGNARQRDQPPTLAKLTPDEQYTYMSMWSLMASPLFYSGDMSRLDDFTLNVLCNSEVIDVNQDPLGKQARIVRHTAEEFVLARPLEDGSLAVGLFNLSAAARNIAVSWADLGITGRRRARDVWRQSDAGSFEGAASSEVAAHGVRFFRLSRRGR